MNSGAVLKEISQQSGCKVQGLGPMSDRCWSTDVVFHFQGWSCIVVKAYCTPSNNINPNNLMKGAKMYWWKPAITNKSKFKFTTSNPTFFELAFQSRFEPGSIDVTRDIKCNLLQFVQWFGLPLNGNCHTNFLIKESNREDSDDSSTLTVIKWEMRAGTKLPTVTDGRRELLLHYQL